MVNACPVSIKAENEPLDNQNTQRVGCASENTCGMCIQRAFDSEQNEKTSGAVVRIG